ncbi:MAG TPA: exopolyphosphatase [Acidimicrobiia bacterium]|nr:exopolyphosphatase [Acidimicrobiia bacterium]
MGVVDIGTNSMRLLITDGIVGAGRWVEVTGLGREVDRTGFLSPEGIEDSLAALARFGREMDDAAVERRLAIATSAARDASDREAFFDLAESALGVRPTLITGEIEARLAFAGATAGSDLEPPVVVSDIGGGSTEFVTADTAVSIDIGSVRLTERSIPSRPAPAGELDAARDLVARLFETVDLEAMTLIGVAGTWTSLAAIALELPEYSRDLVDGYRMQKETLTAVTESLSGKSVEETATIPSLDPKRAPVILAGSLVAEGVMNVLGAERVLVSEHDSLDGAAMELLALP